MRLDKITQYKIGRDKTRQDNIRQDKMRLHEIVEEKDKIR